MKELTPKNLRGCALGAGCPGVFEEGDNYVFIGKVVSDDPQLAGRVGPDEGAVKLPKEFVEFLLSQEQ